MGSPLFLLSEDPTLFVVFVIAIAIAIAIHEFSHAAMATWQGDDTAKNEGRLTLNPLAHLDPIGSIAIVLVGFGWGKPVPFVPFRLRNRRAGAALVGLAGPASNFALAIICAVLMRILYPQGFLAVGDSIFRVQESIGIELLTWLVTINVVLGVFNMLPVPPLDGSRLLSLVVSPGNPVVDFLERYGFLLLIVLLIFGARFLSPIYTGLIGGLVGLLY